MHVESKEGATGEQVMMLAAYVKKFGRDNKLRRSRAKQNALPAIMEETNLEPVVVGRVRTEAQLTSSKLADMKWYRMH